LFNFSVLNFEMILLREKKNQELHYQFKTNDGWSPGTGSGKDPY
jgi:hypothetical protein